METDYLYKSAKQTCRTGQDITRTLATYQNTAQECHGYKPFLWVSVQTRNSTVHSTTGARLGCGTHCELLEALSRVLLGLAQGSDLARLQGLPVQPFKPLVLLDIIGSPIQHAQPPSRLALQQSPNQILSHRKNQSNAFCVYAYVFCIYTKYRVYHHSIFCRCSR